MTDKVLQEFSTRIVRAKALLDNTKSQCTLLKKEAIKLEKEYEDMQGQKRSAEILEQNLKNHYIQTKTSNEQETQKNLKENEDLNQLRELKKKLKRESEICRADHSKNSLILDDLVKERQNLEKVAKKLTEQLEQIQLEKQTLHDEHEYNQNSVQMYTQKIGEIKGEIKGMLGLLSSSFGNELRVKDS